MACSTGINTRIRLRSSTVKDHIQGIHSVTLSNSGTPPILAPLRRGQRGNAYIYSCTLHSRHKGGQDSL